MKAVVNTYVFSQSAGTYTPLSASRTIVFVATAGATGDPGLGDDRNFTLPSATIPFTFNINGAGYTGVNINTNGYLTFGATLPTSSDRTGISNATAWNASIAAMGRDLSANTNAANLGEISYEILGTAPFRKFVVQYSKFRRFSSSSTFTENFNFQIILNEANGVASSQYVDIIYGAALNTSTSTTAGPQVGLRGATNADFNNRTSTTAWASTTSGGTNIAFIRHNTTVNPISGQTFTFTPPSNCTSAAGGVISPATASKCVGQTYSMSSTGFSTGTGTTYQWMSSATSGSGYSSISGATSTSYTTPVLTAGVTYFVLQTTCSGCGPCSAISNELALTVNSNPTVTVNPTSGSICNPGGAAINLTASGAVSYTWSPTTGLTPTTGSPVSAFPSSSSTYTVTGTDANGCTATSTSSIAINAGIVVNSVSALPNSVCPNGNSVLTANAAFSIATYCQSTHTSGCSGDDILSITLNSLFTTASACGLTGSTPPRYLYSTGIGAPTTSLTANSTYTVALSFGTDGNQYFGAWIDYNQNGSLESSEFTGASTNAGASGTTTVVFTVPAGAINGVTRLRVIGGNDSPLTSTQACGASSSAWGETHDFDVTITGGIDPFSYSWSESPANSTLASLTGNPVNANNIPSTTTYSVVVTSSNGCSATGGTSVNVAPLICQAPSVTGPVCSGANFTVTENQIGGGAPFSYAWNDGVGGVYPDAQSITANLPVGAYSFTVTVTDGCGATCSTFASVTVNASPTGTASGPATGVTYSPLIYVISGANPMDSFQWQFSTSPIGPWTNIGINDDTLNISASSAGTFYIQSAITNNSGCIFISNYITTVITVDGDNACSAIALPFGFSGPYTNVGATIEAGEPVPPATGCTVQTGWCLASISHSVWFTFVAPPSGRIQIGNGSPLWDNEFALYSATSCTDFSSFTLIAANDDSSSSPFNARITGVCLVPGQTYYLQVDGYSTTTNAAFFLNLVNETAGVTLSSKAILSGAYDAGTGLMHDSLRVMSQTPVLEPYTIDGKAVIGEASGETTTAAALAVTGSNAIVDWVFLEIRSAVNPATIVATKRALIQRDGDIVGANGTSPVSFTSLSNGMYYVTVKHRNHLGIMTATAIHLGPCDYGTVDFTSGAVWVKAGEVNGPRKMYGALGTLWSSDANNNKNSKYNGLQNDKQAVLTAVGTPNNTLSPVYRKEDVNMDGKVRYNNTDNDRNVIANTVGVSTPNNVVNQHTPN